MVIFLRMQAKSAYHLCGTVQCSAINFSDWHTGQKEQEGMVNMISWILTAFIIHFPRSILTLSGNIIIV